MEWGPCPVAIAARSAGAAREAQPQTEARWPSGLERWLVPGLGSITKARLRLRLQCP